MGPMSALPSAAATEPSESLRGLRRWIGAIAAVGGIVFASLFVASYVDPLFVERTAKEVIRLEVQGRVQERIDAIDAKWLAGRAARLIEIEQAKIAELKQQMSQGLPRRMSVVLEQMRIKSCTCRRIADAIESGYRPGLESRVGQAQHVIGQLDRLIQAKYMETASQLTREFRIFTGTNALVFGLLGLAVWLKKRAGLHLVPATAVLLCATALSAYFYLFSQDWLRTIVFGQYVGLAYLGYVGGVLLLFADIIFNRARGTTIVLHVLGGVVGAFAAVVPC